MNAEARKVWQIWKNICDRITSNKHYRFDDAGKGPYVKLAQFACLQMGIYNRRA